MRIVLMGPPGAGKGTQARRLAERFEMAHLSSGDIFRSVRASGSALGDRLAKYMDAGELVPDDIVVEMMTKAIKAVSAGGGLLLDGFPRTVAQAMALDKQLDEAAKPLDAAVIIRADAIVERITGRRSCPQCGKVYHVKHLRPKQDGVCDECGQALAQRDDDTESVVRQRLDAYDNQTAPVIEYYRQRPGLRMIEVDGNDTPDAVTASLFDALEVILT